MTPSLHCLAADYKAALGFDAPLVCDAGVPVHPLGSLGGVILGRQSEGRAQSLLDRGARCVHVGEAAIDDPELLGRLARHFGRARVGLFVPGRRMANQWSFETTSNADFKVVTPSVCEPAWEVLRADGTPTGLRVHHWVEAMAREVSGTVIVQIDIEDDADLNLCAGLVEVLGERVCIAPAAQRDPALDDWVRHGRVRRIALSPALYARYSRGMSSQASAVSA